MIISIKSSASGGSSRGLVHYLAHSKLDKTKEEVENREFFNESENGLDVKRANQHLSLTGTKLSSEELLHLVIAPGKEEIESVGDDLKTRKEALESIVRATVDQLEKEIKAKKIKWIAVAHFNTDHPHAHLAVQREFINQKGQIQDLRITRQMLHYNETGENGEKKLHKGGLILAAESKLTEIAVEREKTRENIINPETNKNVGKSKIEDKNQLQIPSQPITIPNYHERRVLAEEMLVAAEVARRERNIENLIEHGDKKRFKIKDEETENVHHVSLFDIERKIEIVSRQKAWVLHPKNPAKRAESISLLAEEERAKHLPVITQLETIRRHVLGFENRHLNNAEEKHTRLHNQKLLIEKKYERQNLAIPIPIFTPDELQRLQTEAIREQNIEKILLLENIRHINALELQRPSRRDEDLTEFLATKIVAALKLEAAEKRLADFSKTKDFVKVKIGNSFWSLSLLEQHKNQNASKNGFLKQIKANTLGLIFRAENEISKQEKLEYPVLHKQISDALEEVHNGRRDEIEKQREFNQTLSKIFNGETNPNKTSFAPTFSAFELAEIEDLAQSVGRIELQEKALSGQETFLLEKSAATQNKLTNKNQSVPLQSEKQKQVSETAEKIIGEFISARVAAKVVIANTKVAEAEENINRSNRHKMFIKHRLKDAETGAEREVSWRDVEPKKPYHLLDKILLQIFESKEQKHERELVRQAAKNQEKALMMDLQNNKARLSRLESQINEFQKKTGSKSEAAPVFTPKEIAALEARKYQTTDKQEAEQLARIISEAEQNNRVGRIQDLLNKAAKELETLSPQLLNEPEPKNSPFNQNNPLRQTTIETQEIASQNSLEKNIQPTSNQVKSIEHEKTMVKEKERSR
ncbi:MAG TPA: hypothetical protein PKY82_08085 [Pyrinomonadaceae bacterium]|nr:hypothetical protein [Pyrinomonadaceae bacterium]